MILITRSQDQYSDLEQKLQAKGFETCHFPLIEIIPLKVRILDWIYYKIRSPKAILITSSNAIYYLEKLKLNKETPIFAIGNQTANNLKKIGYKNIKIAANSAHSLLKLALSELAQKTNDKKGLILYLCGEIITKDLAKELRKNGFYSKKVICYKIKEKELLTNKVIEAIKSGKISAATIYSKNTLLIFCKLLRRHNLLEFYKKIKLLCLGDDIVEYSRRVGFSESENINKILDSNHD